MRTALELTSVDPKLVALLDAPVAVARAHAAFLLGELGISWRPVVLAQQVEAEARLVDRLGREQDAGVRDEIIAALGRVGRSKGRATLVEWLNRGNGRAGFALSHLYRRLRDHDIDPSTDLHALEGRLASSTDAVGDAVLRQGITDALSEMDRPTVRNALRKQLGDSDATCRALAARGLSKLAQPDDAPLLEHALADDDERVAAFAAQGITRLADRGLAPNVAVDTMTRSFDKLLRPAVLVALSNAGSLRPELAPIFAKLAEQEKEPEVACLARLAHDRIVGHPELVEACAQTRTRLVARLYAEAAPTHVTDLEPLLVLSRGDDNARAGAAAALGRYDDRRARARLLELCDDSRPHVWGAAAESATQAKLRDAGPILLRHLPLSVDVDDVEAMQALLNALATLQPKGAADKIRPLLHGTPNAIARAAEDALDKLGVHEGATPATPQPPYAALDLGAVGKQPVVRIETTRGVVRIALDVNAAPQTVRNFIGLVQKHFYDGITWHRVVPGFVAQGGDPRGDGSGGAGWLLPCEPNALPYREGTVGMALSGLDTGSSQFFVALAPEPHLEGRYTAFGQVIDGMSTVRALLPDDHILHATLE